MTGAGQAGPIVQSALPFTPWSDAGLARMPGLLPVAGPWIVVDDAYAAQMAERARLLRDHRAAVMAQMPGSETAMEEALAEVLETLPPVFERNGQGVICPDGRRVSTLGAPFDVLGALLQEDLLILDKPGDAAEHVLQAGLLCFPAYWRLSDKIGRPLSVIHAPVPEYDAVLAGRVQRVFDRVPVGRAMWRANVLPRAEAALHQPDPVPQTAPPRFIRSERQTILRLPHSHAILFAVHTYVVPLAALTPEQRATCPI